MKMKRISWCLPGAALLKRGCRSWREWERGDSAPEPLSETETGHSRTLRLHSDPCRTDTAGMRVPVGRDDTRSLPSSGPTCKQPSEDILLVTTSVPWCFSTPDSGLKMPRSYLAGSQVKSSGQAKSQPLKDIKRSKLWLKVKKIWHTKLKLRLKKS